MRIVQKKECKCGVRVRVCMCMSVFIDYSKPKENMDENCRPTMKTNYVFQFLKKTMPTPLSQDENALCGTCGLGYSRVGPHCERCSNSNNLALFVIFGLAWVGFLVFIAGFQGSTAKKKILFYFIQTLAIVLGPSSSWYVLIASKRKRFVYVCQNLQ